MSEAALDPGTGTATAAESSPSVEPEPTAEPPPAAEPPPRTFTADEVQRLIATRDRQWQEWAANQPALALPETTPPATEPSVNVDDEIAALYSDDEVGKRTRAAIDKHFELLLRKRGLDASDRLTRDEVAQIAEAASGKVRDQIRSGLTVTQEVSDYVNRGVISDDDAAILQRTYTAVLNLPQMRAAAEDPANAPWILKGVFADLVKEGKIKPFSKPRPTNPLQPGGSGNAAPKAPTVDPSTSPFKSVRALSKEALSKARETSRRNYDRANPMRGK